LAGLCASLLGDALTLLPRQRLMYAIGAFFLSHLLYTIYFASQMTLSFFWPLPLVLLVLGALLLAIIWTRLEEYRWPICTFIGMTLRSEEHTSELQSRFELVCRLLLE